MPVEATHGGAQGAHEEARLETPEVVCGRKGFGVLVDEMASELAPRLFAVVQEYYEDGEQGDDRIVAWGMAFEDYAEIVGVGGGLRMSVTSLERAVGRFARALGASARVVWVGRPIMAGETVAADAA
ncbi:hypothetical protein [Actinacidiphila oryziradicis]|uniref:hypothetical protein n=1 Tax=Actinacidiphila oryziradicis TaxID=2571141 RepID=UPI0023F126E0|nr:hypothetical protein [Actinacidiphila oryziradicis]MCW2873455.1 hypothetical protein [Actinacidiphila oryziradicis]